jgi:zeta-carotene desaturase
MLDELYAEPSRAFISERGSICKTGSTARIAVDGDRLSGVVVGDEMIGAPIVISSVPWFAFASLFNTPPPKTLQSLVAVANKLESSPIVTVNVWFDRAVLDDDFLGLPGRAFQWVFDKQRIVGGTLSHLSMVSSGAEDIVALDNDAIATRALTDLKSAVPAARAASLRRVSIVRERRATFSLSPSMPRRPSVTTPVDGLFLAGDWIETGLPATIEGAVVSGHAAARAALQMSRTSCYRSSPTTRR